MKSKREATIDFSFINLIHCWRWDRNRRSLRKHQYCSYLERAYLYDNDAPDRASITQEARDALHALEQSEHAKATVFDTPRDEIAKSRQALDITHDAVDSNDPNLAAAIPNSMQTARESAEQSRAHAGGVETATAAAGNANVFTIDAPRDTDAPSQRALSGFRLAAYRMFLWVLVGVLIWLILRR